MDLRRALPTVLAIVGVCAAVLLISWAVRPAPPVPKACPGQWGGEGIGDWVPAAADVEGAGESLVPGEPVEAMICAYPGTNMNPGGERLAGVRVLKADAATMARDLAYLPVTTSDDPNRICTAAGGPMTNFLVRFAYSGGEALWVGGAEEVNSCALATNGTVKVPTYVGGSLGIAYRQGAWRIMEPEDPCKGRLPSRRGQDEFLVPDGAVAVVVCRRDPRDRRPTRAYHRKAEAQALAEALNSSDTWPTEHTFRQVPGARPGENAFTLLFRYADGPDAGVRVDLGAEPPVSTIMLQGDLNDDARALLLRLAPPPHP
ncbi:hypothetical protein AB0M95_03765 [Sphaerisporangium sp. NPDC051017]|uniref:hypothetical protein n=1 Tax=Sphaerisporangium sp. NPDC051017 TaxID=3154636 RepID=UPI003414CA52